jgi:hypothetical protein
MRRMFGPMLVVTSCLALGTVGVAATTAPAFAAGTGYTPGANPTPGGTATGLAGTVVTSTTIQPSGGTATGSVGSATVSVSVPAGAFTGPVQLVLTDAAASSVTSSAGSTVVTFGLGIFENGTKVTGTFPAITVTVSSSSITAGSTVYIVTGSGLQAVSGASVTNGSATFSITSDPVVEVVAAAANAAAAGTAIPGATLGLTGKPFLLEGGMAAALVVFGALLLIGLSFRRRTA